MGEELADRGQGRPTVRANADEPYDGAPEARRARRPGVPWPTRPASAGAATSDPARYADGRGGDRPARVRDARRLGGPV
ncbi:hypothetical protein GCM10010274_26390 [Streptomyces lavendofoliae]|uniref:Uncharacterized protein n=1 Tax=Streptomyces lavendofoliae TaxID=67314 RepID=A0A918HYL1_9ACTN|nr:hypothetical protein GCM10010274_26390 [Streptomyces lavendofoliae]